MTFSQRGAREILRGQPLAFDLCSTVLDRSARGFACDALALDAPPLHDNSSSLTELGPVLEPIS